MLPSIKPFHLCSSHHRSAVLFYYRTLSSMAEKKPKIVIIGAGMAGLTAASKLPADLFDVSVLEAGDRIGGRINTSEFAGNRIELGATWIHGIDGSPIHAIAEKIHALDPDPDLPWELMDGHPSVLNTVRVGGQQVDPSVFARVSSLYKTLKSGAAANPVARCSMGSYLRSGLQAHLDSLENDADVDAELEKAVFAIYENIERTYTSAGDLDDLDVTNESEYKEYPGEHITIPRGYSRVVESLASTLPAGSVRLGRKVSRIDWSGTPVSVHVDDGEVVPADHVIVTVSLGVLKAGGLEFSPALPSDKAGAIARLGFGVMDKVFAEVDKPVPHVLLAFDRGYEGIPRWMRKSAGILPVNPGARVIHVWLAGEEAVEMEGMEEGDVVGGVQATMGAFGCGEARVVAMRRSGWAGDPLFRGSYSYIATGSRGEDLDAMAEPLPELRVLFAGEATQRAYFSTTHGAYLSGVREAERLLRLYGRQP